MFQVPCTKIEHFGLFLFELSTDRQTDRQTDKQTNKQTKANVLYPREWVGQQRAFDIRLNRIKIMLDHASTVYTNSVYLR